LAANIIGQLLRQTLRNYFKIARFDDVMTLCEIPSKDNGTHETLMIVNIGFTKTKSDPNLI
jgi:hypothetical protein